MAISRADLEAMDRDELIEEIVELRQTVDDLETRFDAMSTWTEDLEDRLVDVEAENEQLREEVDALTDAVQTDPSAKDYQDMDREDRVETLRIALARRAAAQPNGKAAYDYTDVLSLFDEHPSDGYAYKLMRAAAGYDQETQTSTVEGYTYTKRPQGNDQLRVDLAAVNDQSVIHAVKNGGGS